LLEKLTFHTSERLPDPENHLRQTIKKGDCNQPQLASFLSPHDILIKKSKTIRKIDEKRLRKKVALIKTDYEEGRLQPTPAGHPTLPLSP
jgi:hypothetical protein